MSATNQRFNQYTEIVKNNQVVGFKLDDTDFEFIFDKHGGWFDEQGRYYNADAIQSEPPQDNSSDSESQHEQKQPTHEHHLEQSLMCLNLREQNNRVEVMRNLNQILESYPENEQIIIFVSLQPAQMNEDSLIEEFLLEKLGQKLGVKQGQIVGVFEQQLAVKIIQLQGTKLQKLPQKPTLYIDIQLFDSIEVLVNMRKSELQLVLNKLNYEKNIDYANIVEEVTENGQFESTFEIRKDIRDELRQDIQFEVLNE